MTRARAEQSARARWLLTHEGASARSAEHCATAAGRVLDKLNEQLVPLLGAAGVQALLVRSAKLAQGELACLADLASLETSARLRACLQALDPGVAMATAEALFGTFLALVTTFIGERLTLQALRASWPNIEARASTENNK